MNFLDQIDNYTNSVKHRGCINGNYGKIYNFNSDTVRNLGCNNWNCLYCRPMKKYNLFLATYYLVINLDLNRHFVMTFGGSKFRNEFSWEESYYIMSEIWSKFKDVIEYNYGPFDYIQFPRAQRDGYCHYHTLIPMYIPFSFLEKKRKELYPELGYLRIMKNVDVAQYLHRDFYKDPEYYIADGYKHFRTSRGIELKSFKTEFQEENKIFVGRWSEGQVNEIMKKKYGRMPLDLYINEINEKEAKK
jgi:hypothetical protein